MPRLMLDHQTVTVPQGTTLLEAAQRLQIPIPTLCHVQGLKPHTRCMVCLVEVQGRRDPVPACSALAEEGMVVLTGTPALHMARQEAVALLLSEHTGDCLAPCQLACPHQINIPAMIRHIQKGRFDDALAVVAQRADASNPALCKDCRKPCETVCRRSRYDASVAISTLVQTAQAAAVNKPATSELTEPRPRLKSLSQIRHLTEQELHVFVEQAAAYGRMEPGPNGSFDREAAIRESLRCLHCDCRKNDDCALRRTAEALDARPSAFAGERLPHAEHHQPDFIFEPAKCIRCGICVSLCEQAGLDNGLTFLGRGFDMTLAVPFERYADPGLAAIIADCIARCPTGALSKAVV